MDTHAQQSTKFKSYFDIIRGMKAAIWADVINDFRNEADVTAFLEWCSKVGMDLLLPCINHGTGTVCYESKLAPIAKNCTDWDPLGLIIKGARERGMQVHPWVVIANWGSSLLPRLGGREYFEGGPQPLQADHPDYFVVDSYGYSVLDAPSIVYSAGGSCYIDLGKESVRNFVFDLIKELVRKYPYIDGVHLDYIRYQSFKNILGIDYTQAKEFGRVIRSGDEIWVMRKWQQDPSIYDARFVFKVTEKKQSEPSQTMQAEREYSYCYCNSCLEKFQSEYSVSIPYDLKTTYEKAQWIEKNEKNRWNEWRISNVTSVVSGIRKILNDMSPLINLSAATFWNYSAAKELVAQDWVSWITQGLLDFVNPMTYWIDPNKIREALTAYRRLIKNEIFPIYPGVLTSADYRITRNDLSMYFDALREGGASGITLFSYSLWSSEFRRAKSLPLIEEYDDLLSSFIREQST